jgi:hypothetical protein
VSVAHRVGTLGAHAFGLLVVVALAACHERVEPVAAQVARTGFPGDVTAGGGTSGEVMARASASGANPTEAGTPGIAQGAEGNTGGAALGGTTGNSSIAASGEKSPAQRAKGANAELPRNASPASPAAR